MKVKTCGCQIPSHAESWASPILCRRATAINDMLRTAHLEGHLYDGRMTREEWADLNTEFGNHLSGNRD